MSEQTITINSINYPLKWKVGNLLRFRKLPETDDKFEESLNLLFAMLPKDAFASVEDMAEVLEVNDLLGINEKVTAVMGDEKKSEVKEATEQ